MNVFKSIGSVVVGLVTGMAIVIGLTYLATILFFEGDFNASPTDLYLVLNIAYSFGAAILAGWVAGRLAGKKPLAHAAGVAVIMLVLSVGGGGDSDAGAGVPGWYGPFLMLFMPVGALLGGWIGGRRMSQSLSEAEPG